MNKFLLIINILLFTGYSHSQQWRKVVEGSFPELKSIYFINETTGFSVGHFGTILKSTDTGKNWTLKTSGTSKFLYDICFPGDSIGFAVGQDRTILHTLDNGETWILDSLTALPDPKADINKIYFEDKNKGWCIANITEKSWILHSTDGGLNWFVDDTVNTELLDMAFNNGKGIVTGKRASQIYYKDEGSKWIKSEVLLNWPDNIYQNRSDIRSIFMNDSIAYATGWGSLGQPTIHIKSTDHGITWEYLTQKFENRTFDNLFSIYFKDEFNGIAVGGSNIRGALVVKTNDGGLNWEKVIVPFGGSINSVFSIENKLWLCGSGGLIAFSEDFGNTWKLNTIPNFNLASIEFPSSNIGYAGGYNGVFFRTTDAGENWNTAYLYNGSTVNEIHDLQFLNESFGYSAHDDRTVSKTTDGGSTWNVLISDTSWAPATSNSVYFVNENLGFSVGQKAIGYDNIFKTQDGGFNWQRKDSLVGKELKSIKFYNESNGVAAGSGMKILYTIDGGETWLVPDSINNTSGKKDPSLNSVAYAYKDLLYAAGASVLFRSSDGGANWDYVDLPEKTTWNSINFQDSSTGYMVGGSYIMKTTDSGYSWTNISDSTISGTLYDIDIDEKGFVWVCGTNSTIYTNKETTSDVALHEIPSEFTLSQNYPNPFNPSTTIIYTVPKEGIVELRVYDVLGQEVRTLINEFQQAGTHRTTFNAGQLSSGTYFYTIKYNNLLQSRKMTLIK